MKVLGLDPGSRASGFGLVDYTAGAFGSYEFGVWRESSPLLSVRLESLFRRCEEFLERSRPAAAAIETIFAGKSVASAFALAQTRGILVLACARAEIPIFEYEPLTVKKTITGYGRAEKPQTRDMVRSLLSAGQTPIPLDAADALATAICHCHHSSALNFDHHAAAC
ncbi:MAG: crossover junction endodeoxyribonuclease RuvC [Thermoanaerobaculia bacterium]